MAFYRQALQRAGFQNYSSTDNDNFAMIAAKRVDDRITVTFKNKSDCVEADESELSVKAEYKKIKPHWNTA